MSTATKNRPRLGRGLSSLISVSNLPVESEIGHADATPPPVHSPKSDASPNRVWNPPADTDRLDPPQSTPAAENDQR